MVVNHHESSEKQGEKGDNTNQYPHHNQASICSGVHMCLLNSDDDNDSGTQLLKWFWWALVLLCRSICKHPKTGCFMVSLKLYKSMTLTVTHMYSKKSFENNTKSSC